MEAWREELYHHGTKGMKWGIRRYQNADGTLTPAGQKRYAKLANKLSELGNDHEPYKPSTAVNAEGKTERYKTETPKYGRDDYKYLNDRELQARNNRLQMEATYRQNYDKLHPQKKSLGRKFVENILTPAAKEATKEATKSIISAMLDPAVVAVKDSISKSVEKSKAKKQKKEDKKNETKTTTKSKTDKEGNIKTTVKTKGPEGSSVVTETTNADGSSFIEKKERKH